MRLIPISEIRRLPFVDNAPRDGRNIVLESYFDSDAREWHLYLEVEEGQLGRIAGGEPVYGGYLSKIPADPSRDIELPFATLITQHLSFPKVHGRLKAVENDFHQCAAIMEKYQRFWLRRAESGFHTNLLVASELEYLLLLMRSLYDLIHAIVAEIAQMLVALDGTNRRPARQLPDSFNSVVMNGNQFRSGDEIVAKYGLPLAVADWYVLEAPVFRELRRLRDGIAHHGRTVPTIFELPEGLAFDATDPTWREFTLWPPERRVREKFGSVRALFAGVILNALSSTTEFEKALRRSVQLPPAVGNDIKSYIRSPFGAHLVALPEVFSSPWEGAIDSVSKAT
jgi:hypothetical protein